VNRSTIDLWVGIFVAIGFGAILFLALKVGNLLTLDRAPGYHLSANFDNIGGLKLRAPVKAAGVIVGRVEGIRLDPKNYEAIVTMRINRDVEFTKDTIASINTSGLLGEVYIGFDAGGDLVLDSEDVRGVPIEALRPELEAAADVGQLGRDAQPVARRPHAAFEDVSHRQGPGDRRKVSPALLGSEGRRPRCDTDPGDLRESVHDLVGHSLAEVVVVLRRAHVGERQHGDRDLCGRFVRRLDSEARLAQPFQEIPDELRVEPFLEEQRTRFGEVGLAGEQIAQRLARGIELSQLGVGSGEDHALPEVLGQARLHDLVHRRAIAAEAVLVDAEDQLVPSGMMGVDIHRPAQERESAVPSPGECDEEDGLVASVERIQRDRALGGAEAGGGLLPEEEHDGESLLREGIRRGEVHGAPSGCEGTVEGPGPRVEAVRVLVRIDPREHRPAVGVGGRPLDGPLQHVPRLRVLLRAQPKVIPEAAH